MYACSKKKVANQAPGESVMSSDSVKVVFFASLREAVGMAELEVKAHSLSSLIDDLRGQLNASAIDALTAENVRIAIDQTLLEEGDNPTFNGGEEVAFLPPVTGG